MAVMQSETRISLQSILFATDFSSSSEAALPFALAVARAYDSRFYVAHVIRPDLFEIVPEVEAHALRERTRRHAEEQMAALLVSGRMRDVPHQVLIAEGQLWTVLSALIEEHQIDLVVLGTHGRTGARKLLLGSAAEEIFRQASCPVLTVGPHVEGAPVDHVQIRRLLLATDFSQQAERSTAYAISLAQEHQARVTLLHVIREPQELSDRNRTVLQEFFTRRLEGLIPAEANLWCQPEGRVAFGEPSAEILKAAAKEEVDLLVVGVRRTGNFAGHLPPATAYKIVCQAHCPVLTVRG